jgi:hypothetical protein
MVNAYLRFVEAQESRAVAKGSHRTTGCEYSDVQGDVMVY